MTELSRRCFPAGAAAAGVAMTPLLDTPLRAALRRRTTGTGSTPPARARMAATAAKSVASLTPAKPIAARHGLANQGDDRGAKRLTADLVVQPPPVGWHHSQ
jgi:hypothetical protein